MGTQEWGTYPWARVSQGWGHLHALPLTPQAERAEQLALKAPSQSRGVVDLHVGAGSSEGEAEILI